MLQPTIRRFRREAVELLKRSGKSVPVLASELGGGLRRVARRGGVGFAADEDHAPAEPLVAPEVESLQLVSYKARGEFIGCSAAARSRKRLTAMMSPSPQSIT